MAIMHPQSLDNFDPTPSERVFYDELKKQLDDSFHVFYSVKWYRKNNQGIRINSECDFLVFTSNFGFLTIEVKGGTNIEINDRHWILHYKDENGRPAQRDLGNGPYAQADKSMYYFYDYYKQETLSKFQGSYGMAVAFPFFNVDRELENDAPKELTIQFDDMPNLKQRINEIFHYWRGRHRGFFLSNSQATKFVNLVNKRIALSVAAGALIPITERKLKTINIVQDSVISILTNYRRVRIIGGAGTGKTWIAMKKSKLQSSIGGRCLFTAYSTSLVNYVKTQLEDIDCIAIEDLFKRELSEEDLESLRSDGNGDKCYYEALSRSSVTKYDSIVIDEAQDFTEDWAKSIGLFTKEDGIFWIFYDENQNIFKRSFGAGFNINTPPYILLNNIRNTRNIHAWIKDRSQIGEQIISNDICGCDPEIYEYQNSLQVDVFLNTTLIQLIKEEGVKTDTIVVLSSDQAISNWSGKEYGEYRLSESVESIHDIRISTVSAFKGLEAGIVIFLNDWPNSLPKTAEYYYRLYLAGTRAKYYLYIVNYPGNNG